MKAVKLSKGSEVVSQVFDMVGVVDLYVKQSGFSEPLTDVADPSHLIKGAPY